MRTINIQPTEKQYLGHLLELDVHSIFYTIQGEGPFAGERAVFVRLAGCNLQCPLCDTDYTEGRKMMEVGRIIQRVKKVGGDCPLVVITGGEPFRQNIKALVWELIHEGFRVQIETNGTLFMPDLPYDDRRLTIVCSPKAGKVNSNLEQFIDAYKYVLHADQVDPKDGLPTLALNHSASPRVARPHPNFSGRIYLQPVDEKDDVQNRRHLQAVIASVMKHGYTLGLQIHKIINME